ncbi:hypothetical protein QUA20_25575 [Microcoleus sp. Pol7_A1]|uniref:hypothetical protein n=1 Tax=Microcoleus sp. Pol7_A1 TaxID=2818893 RepID=UPI002FD3CED0
MSKDKGFSDFLKNILCRSILFPTQIQESHSDRHSITVLELLRSSVSQLSLARVT